ncbi:sigma-70 family RNA polymerase sigma factor [Winogradskyella thalassocola]|uniref:RNA polymerase sigma-70 factor, ECF subfamily n=1 Tax=Winogradskyella thalassocola TaxID=262004 RepID=A0A1G7WEH6_9FLAO|nr:sigma-70 family RNA polymerase sigma factor [Winogradskyella thalassocola]SDG70346.1 RNA polymerase sigma-70 factor, ECF subfamily [Winogradskyella thalassocola]
MKIKSIRHTVIKNEDLFLFEQMQEGNTKALDLFFKKYYQKLCRFGVLFESNSHIIEEKVDDVFISLWSNRDQLNKIKNPKSYIYAILKNDLLRVKKNYEIRSLQNEDHLNNSSLYPSIEDEIIANEQKEINRNVIKNVLESIPKRTRQIFEMSRIDGFKYKEISELLDIAPKTVENHIGLALKHISVNINKLK